MAIFLLGAALLISAPTMLAGEPFPVRVTTRKVTAHPKTEKLDGPFPRSILMVTLQEPGEHPDDKTVTSIWVFDPEKPSSGLLKIFDGPGQGQSFYFESPSFGGYGLARGQLNQKKEPESERSVFWFNALDGTRGPSVDVDI